VFAWKTDSAPLKNVTFIIGNFALRQSSGAAPARYVYLEHAPGRSWIAEGGPEWSGGEASAIGTLLSECAAGTGRTLSSGASWIYVAYTCARALSSRFLLIDERRLPCLGIMHRLDAPGRLFPTAAICTGIKMANQAIQHIDDSLRKHHSSALLTLSHCILQCFRSRWALLGQFSQLE
jgi:hypothetical protein